MSSKIQLKRTNKTLSNLSSQTLFFGEPLYIDVVGEDSLGNATHDCYLVIGDSTSSTKVPAKRLIRLADPSVAGGALFLKNNKLVDANGTEIPLSNIQANLTFKTQSSGSVVATYNGSSAVAIYPELIGAIASANPQATTPSVSETVRNRIATVGYVKDMLETVSSKGYTLKNTLPASGTPLDWNTEYRLGSLSGSLSVKIPSVTTVSSTEIRLCFFTADDTTFTPTVDANVTLLGMEDFAVLQSDCYYEISLCNIGSDGNTNYVSVLANQINIG